MSKNIKYHSPDNLTGAYMLMITFVKSCKMVQKWSENDGRKFKNNRDNAMKPNYRPEIDISDKLGDKLATQY